MFVNFRAIDAEITRSSRKCSEGFLSSIACIGSVISHSCGLIKTKTLSPYMQEMLTYVQDKHEVKMQAAVSMHPGTSGVSSRPTSARTSTEGEGRPVSRPVNAAGASGQRQATGVQAQFDPWQFNHRVGNERGEFPHQARGYLRKNLQKVDDQVENFPKRAKFDMAPSNSSLT